MHSQLPSNGEHDNPGNTQRTAEELVIIPLRPSAPPRLRGEEYGHSYRSSVSGFSRDAGQAVSAAAPIASTVPSASSPAITFGSKLVLILSIDASSSAVAAIASAVPVAAPTSPITAFSVRS